jgi:hypothetical protein
MQHACESVTSGEVLIRKKLVRLTHWRPWQAQRLGLSPDIVIEREAIDQPIDQRPVVGTKLLRLTDLRRQVSIILQVELQAVLLEQLHGAGEAIDEPPKVRAIWRNPATIARHGDRRH